MLILLHEHYYNSRTAKRSNTDLAELETGSGLGTIWTSLARLSCGISPTLYPPIPNLITAGISLSDPNLFLIEFWYAANYDLRKLIYSKRNSFPTRVSFIILTFDASFTFYDIIFTIYFISKFYDLSQIIFIVVIKKNCF